MRKLLVVDDEPNILFTVKQTFSSSDLHVIEARTAKEGLLAFEREKPNVVLLDIRLPDMSGLDAFERIRQIDARIPVVMMTAFGRTETAIDAMRRGAFEYFVKPVDLPKLRMVLERAMDASHLSSVPAVVGDDDDHDVTADRIIGLSPGMQEVYKLIGRVASQNVTVLILGESGTGKELVARAIYHYSDRSQRPFLAVNCAALPEPILESELFGHERGAFTGADKRRIGKFEQVNGGTIFLDEIGDMSLATQAKALRLLQQQQFERIGGNDTVSTDVRIITATNRDLAEMSSQGTFRQDLFYRLNGYTIQIPPLRSRKEDILPIVQHLIRRFNLELNHCVRGVSAAAEQILLAHDWPGNVRELQSAIRYAMVQSVSETITEDHLPQTVLSQVVQVRGSRPASEASAADSDDPTGTEHDLRKLVAKLIEDGEGEVYRRLMVEVDRVALPEAMRVSDGNQQRAAELLGLSRMTLRAKLRAIQ